MTEELKAEHAEGLEIALKAMIKHRVANGGVHLDAIALLEGMIEEARAQLPSQGGEAVAWRVTGRGGITVTAQYPEWAEADCLLTITPLYTHPADQAAEGVVVSRELLERAADIITNSVVYSPEACERVAKELGQLLAESEGVKK